MLCLHELFDPLDFQITEQPQEKAIVSFGESVTLHVSTVGSGQLSYTWRKDGQEITDRDIYAGINTAVLTITSFADKCEGNYTCIVENDGTTIQSNSAKLELSK